MAVKYQLQDFSKLQNRGVFVDANILIYLFWPTGRHYYEQNYASVFKNLIQQGNDLFVDFLVISEVVNRILRIEHDRINSNLRFKEFRNSKDGKDALNDIYIIIKNNVLNRFQVIGKSFTKQEIESSLIVHELDFVDKATVALCKENSLVLLTNDRDFKNTDIDILTGNRQILN
jgi:predicted nucleic acid-binding protein